MEIRWKVYILCLGLLANCELCHGLPINLENTVADSHTQFLTGLVAVLLTICSVVLLAGCLCCQRRNGFKEFRDSPVVASSATTLDHGHINPVANGEFTIFTPLSPPHQNNNIFLANEQIITRTQDDYVYGDVDVSSWFNGSEKDFPRIKLKYIKEIGRGWFGRVVEGAALDLGNTDQKWTPVVVRILEATASSRERVVFLHDAAIYRSGTHPNILRLYGRCLDTIPLLLLQEYCPQGDLKKYLRQNATEPDKLLSTEYPLVWCCQLTSALKHLHNNKLTHPDLAARNCQLTTNLTLKLGDYGLSVLQYSDDYYQGAPGVPVRWCAPESLSYTNTTIETKKITPEANVWSLAVTIWEIYSCGERPYSELTDDEVISQVLGSPGVRLTRPKVQVLYSDYIYRLMQSCWTCFESRPAVSQVDLILTDLLQVYKNTSRIEDFDKRWESFKPNNIVKTDNHTTNTDLDLDESTEIVTSHKTLSPSLNNLHGSLDNLLAGNEMESWLENVAKTGDMSYVKGLSDAIKDLDNALALENSTSSESSSHSPPKLQFQLGPLSSTRTPIAESPNQNDSLTDSMLFVQRTTSSESETEEENWRKKIERGAYTEKVRQKSRSVADLMVLTHIEPSESESETPLPSLDYRINYKNVRYAPKQNLENVSLMFGSEGNLLNVQETFQEELKKLREERRDSLLFVPENSSQDNSSENLLSDTNNYVVDDSPSKRLMQELNSTSEIKPPNQVFNVFNVTIDQFSPVHLNTLNEIIHLQEDECLRQSEDECEGGETMYDSGVEGDRMESTESLKNECETLTHVPGENAQKIVQTDLSGCDSEQVVPDSTTVSELPGVSTEVELSRKSLNFEVQDSSVDAVPSKCDKIVEVPTNDLPEIPTREELREKCEVQTVSTEVVPPELLKSVDDLEVTEENNEDRTIYLELEPLEDEIVEAVNHVLINSIAGVLEGTVSEPPQGNLVSETLNESSHELSTEVESLKNREVPSIPLGVVPPEPSQSNEIIYRLSDNLQNQNCGVQDVSLEMVSAEFTQNDEIIEAVNHILVDKIGEPGQSVEETSSHVEVPQGDVISELPHNNRVVTESTGVQNHKAVEVLDVTETSNQNFIEDKLEVPEKGTDVQPSIISSNSTSTNIEDLSETLKTVPEELTETSNEKVPNEIIQKEPENVIEGLLTQLPVMEESRILNGASQVEKLQSDQNGCDAIAEIVTEPIQNENETVVSNEVPNRGLRNEQAEALANISILTLNEIAVPKEIVAEKSPEPQILGSTVSERVLVDSTNAEMHEIVEVPEESFQTKPTENPVIEHEPITPLVPNKISSGGTSAQEIVLTESPQKDVEANSSELHEVVGSSSKTRTVTENTFQPEPSATSTQVLKEELLISSTKNVVPGEFQVLSEVQKISDSESSEKLVAELLDDTAMPEQLVLGSEVLSSEIVPSTMVQEKQSLESEMWKELLPESTTPSEVVPPLQQTNFGEDDNLRLSEEQVIEAVNRTVIDNFSMVPADCVQEVPTQMSEVPQAPLIEIEDISIALGEIPDSVNDKTHIISSLKLRQVPKLVDLIQDNDALMDYIITRYEAENADRMSESFDSLEGTAIDDVSHSSNTINKTKEFLDIEIKNYNQEVKVDFDLSDSQDEAMPNSLTHSSMIFATTSTPFGKNSLQELTNPQEEFSSLNLFGDQPNNTNLYSLETWDNFLGKALDDQNESQLFDSFTSEPQSLLFVGDNGNESPEKKNNSTFVMEKEVGRNEATWETPNGGGWFLHPQSTNEEITGEITVPPHTDSYVGFNVDDEIMTAIRNELLNKLPQAQGASNGSVTDDEEWDSAERNEVFLRYNVYNTPLSPIPEESLFETSCDTTPRQQQSDDEDNDESDWSEHNRPLHRHTPSQDSCCSNDTLFNLEDVERDNHSPPVKVFTKNEDVDRVCEDADVSPQKNEAECTAPVISDKTYIVDFIKNEIESSCFKVTEPSEQESNSDNLLPFINTKQVAPLPSPEDKPWKQLPASLLTYDKVNVLLPNESQGSSEQENEYVNIPNESDNRCYENVAHIDDIYNEADYVSLENTKNNEFIKQEDEQNEYANCTREIIVNDEEGKDDKDVFAAILTDIRFSGPSDSNLMTTSFSESNDLNDEEQDWDSGSDTRSSSSGEFIWKEGEHEESLKALRAAPQDVLEDVKAVEDIREETPSESSESDDDDDEGESPEFVPSAWDKFATPTKSALRSPEKTLEKTEKKKSKGVWFKKQKYHCVYEYPREPDSPVLHSYDLWKHQPDYSSFADWELDETDQYVPSENSDDSENLLNYQPKSIQNLNLYQLSSIPDFTSGESDEFFVSSSTKPFDVITGLSSQFFPGNWSDLKQSENVTPDSGVEDITPAGILDDFLQPPPLRSVQTLKELASEAVKRTKSRNNDVLGGLRHTRNRLKLDLPPSPSAFTSNKVFNIEPTLDPVVTREKPTFTTFGKSRFLVQHVDTPPCDEAANSKNVSFEALPYKPLQKQLIKEDFNSSSKNKGKVEIVRGEASLLDSADEDSGIESSTLERKLCN